MFALLSLRSFSCQSVVHGSDRLENYVPPKSGSLVQTELDGVPYLRTTVASQNRIMKKLREIKFSSRCFVFRSSLYKTVLLPSVFSRCETCFICSHEVHLTTLLGNCSIQ